MSSQDEKSIVRLRETNLAMGCPPVKSLQLDVAAEEDHRNVNTMKKIGEAILGALDGSSSRRCKATFLLAWDPLKLVEEHSYVNSQQPGQLWNRLSGDITGYAVDDAQAITARNYLLQTWPTNGGDVVHPGAAPQSRCPFYYLYVIRSVLTSSVPVHWSFYPDNLSDVTGLEACLGDRNFST